LSESVNDAADTSNKPVRLQKILSTAGIASRREAEKMISAGRVLVNGATAVLGQAALPGSDNITVDGQPLTASEKLVYLMLNKPCGYLTTVRDERGRKTVMELVSGVNIRVYPIGRLDLNSEGLLLFTNDGDFANKIMHPSFNKKKTYQLKVRGDVHKAIGLLKLPVAVDDYEVTAVDAQLISQSNNGGVIKITISEGRNRQVRKMCAACGLIVDALKRISVGELSLGNLSTGKWRFLTENEVESFG